jgi:hypothetical protein
MVAAALLTAAAAPRSFTGTVLVMLSGAVTTALVFSAWEWGLHRYLYHRDRGPALRPVFLTHHRDHHYRFFPPWRLTSDTFDDGSAGAHPSVWTAVLSGYLGRPVAVSDRLVYLLTGVGLIGGGGALVTGRPVFVAGVLFASIVIGLLFTRVHAAIHHPGAHPRLETLPGFAFLARHHHVHHLDTEVNANFLLPLADWLFGTLRLSVGPRPG